ncbi:glycosyltransferase [Rhizobium sp. EC-SD404]|uniref:glycosyltransferase n=1 Tax=Rhizobium sp. EC-SD404 TaxID=2038389 RepID=UPI0018FEADD6|nr:glycosyltransferase [Rhizobium sp. EC-SD404]
MAAYLARYSDVRASGQNPLIHYIQAGRAEARDASPLNAPLLSVPAPHELAPAEFHREIEALFDPAFYALRNPDVVQSGLPLLNHFIEHGLQELRDPAEWFSMRGYLEFYPDVLRAGENPLIHFILHGKKEGRTPIACSQEQRPPSMNDEKKRVRREEMETVSEIAPTSVLSADAAVIGAHFDKQFYLEHYGWSIPDDQEPIEHFLEVGWRDGFDPNQDFSVEYYRMMNDDIRRANINPFVHYCRNGRAEMREGRYYADTIADFSPIVSIIVPNYNHSSYLHQRLDSIFGQTYKRIEVIILDDNSIDNSREVIAHYIKEHNVEVKTIYNDRNSGNVFKQWEKGIKVASGDLIWICESDDFCDPHFLERSVDHFKDLSVNLVFGDVQFVDESGIQFSGLDEFREQAEAGVWTKPLRRTAKQWFDGAFGVHNVVVNVGGCVFRRCTLPESVWKRAQGFKVAGDWYLYTYLIGTGSAVYEPSAKAYFRQHDRNTSGIPNRRLDYINEHAYIAQHLVSMWGIPKANRQRFIESVRTQYHYLKMDGEYGSFEERFPIEDILGAQRSHQHVVIAFLGFHSGGGEVFPIQLANRLAERGHMVSMLAYNMSSINWDMVGDLNAGIPVYHVSDVKRIGRGEFGRAIGASIVHSHMMSCDMFLLSGNEPPLDLPYVVTMHGSYDSVGREAFGLLFEILRGVTYWVYTAEKNLGVFDGIPIARSRFKKIPNALAHDLDDFAFSREELGIDADSVVFTLVARGIKRKGWRAAVTAFRKLKQRVPDGKFDLILVGSGDQADKIVADIQPGESIHFLGYQSQINGLYRLSDVALVPSRFQGESFPLCVIQALQEGVPVIGSDVGEIKKMLSGRAGKAGIVIRSERDSDRFFDSLSNAMETMLDLEVRSSYGRRAKSLARKFDLDRMLEAYEKAYQTAIRFR